MARFVLEEFTSIDFLLMIIKPKAPRDCNSNETPTPPLPLLPPLAVKLARSVTELRSKLDRNHALCNVISVLSNAMRLINTAATERSVSDGAFRTEERGEAKQRDGLGCVAVEMNAEMTALVRL